MAEPVKSLTPEEMQWLIDELMSGPTISLEERYAEMAKRGVDVDDLRRQIYGPPGAPASDRTGE